MRDILLVIHILLGISWVGGIMFIGWGVFPATLSMSLGNQRKFLIKLMDWTHLLFTLIGSFVIYTGILLGTIFGPIRSFDVLFHTRYGNIWLTALIIGVFAFLWGVFVGYRGMMRVFKDDFIWKEAENGNKKPLIRRLIGLTIMESIEVIGFVILVVLMVLF